MFTKVHLRILYVFSFLTACFVQVSAHEFWIEPTKYQLNDNIINAHLRVGQEFQGMALMYNPQDFKTFKILSGSKNKKEKVKGILGDVPALNTKTKLEDLLIIYHETTDKFVNYKKFQKFKDFVSEKGYEQLIQTHLDKDFPQSNFMESYRRYAKSLITTSSASKGKDKKTGLLFEFVLDQNPYTNFDSNQISATLYYKKKPLPNNLVTIFSKYKNSKLSVSNIKTDEKGKFTFEIEQGKEYLLDSVVIYPLKSKPDEQEPIWHSDWASTTFLVPENNL